MDRSAPRMSVFQQVAVLVPFEVADVVLPQQGVDPIVDVLPGFRVDEVHDVLVPPLEREPAALLVGRNRGANNPLGMGARDVRIKVDHLRFHPQPELHAAGRHRLDERCQPLGPHRFIHVPVAQPGMVITAATEPAVVQHKAFHAQISG